MVGANIGGREWLFGPLVTAQFGGRILWLATVSIIVQVAYNLSVMRYTLYTGETIFVGFFRTWPGPRFWTLFYLSFEIGSVWPYLLELNATKPTIAGAAQILDHLSGLRVLRRVDLHRRRRMS